jgi:integrase
LLCMFTLGLRPSEAIGLRWRDYDGEAMSITSALGRGDRSRTSSKARRRRSTKTGEQGNRTLPVGEALRNALDARRQEWAQRGWHPLPPPLHHSSHLR